ncbi:MAG TPA: DUF4132 domain-containing protein [Candidatus Kapabacteria bacterium]|nr:DUF4132 domain-containing protein [Candidatus Kapabacteria bacterium]
MHARSLLTWLRRAVGSPDSSPDGYPLHASDPYFEQQLTITRMLEEISALGGPNAYRRDGTYVFDEEGRARIAVPDDSGEIVLYGSWDEMKRRAAEIRAPDRTEAGRAILSTPSDERTRMFLAILIRAGFQQADKYGMPDYGDRMSPYEVYSLCSLLAQRFLDDGLAISTVELIGLLPAAVTDASPGADSLVEPLMAAVDRRIATEGLTPETRAALVGLAVKHEERAQEHYYSETWKSLRRWIEKSLAVDAIDWILPSEPWAASICEELSTLEGERRSAWAGLVEHAFAATSTTPTAKWSKEARARLSAVSEGDVAERLERWLRSLGSTPASVTREENYQFLKGLLWYATLIDDKGLGRAICEAGSACYRKIPGVGARSIRAGNAAIYALGQLPGLEAVAQLAKLRRTTNNLQAHRQIEKAMERAAAARGMSTRDLEEIAVPTFGLDEQGIRQETLGEFTAELRIVGSNVTLEWIGANGRRAKSPPAAVKREHADEVKELKQIEKEIAKVMLAHRDRIERLLLEERSWQPADWRERYLEHPFIGVMARRLIWSLTIDGVTIPAIWHDGSMVDVEGRRVARLEEATSVRLWHPIESDAAGVLAWRVWLETHEVLQPFKQAHREIYLLTDAERATGTYSNRFAAHILRQHQFNALCKTRGWRNALQGWFDSGNTCATLELPGGALSASFWVEAVIDEAHATESGISLYVATDQVRFIDEHYQPVLLERIPPLLFSEAMRDVDLFVGVASVGNDERWQDGGPDGRYATYWQSYAFGELGESARTRRDVLSRLVPRLKIADRLDLEETFLRVRGDLRVYRIHLGSGNILMEPNSQYLCIVPDKSRRAAERGTLFLPMEGDTVLSTILSKAFLLAADREITDPTITRQIEAASV